MFLYETHLPQILSRKSYTSHHQHLEETERLFLPSWHFVGTRGDVPRDGDYVTTSLLDRPLVIWNVDGHIHTFINICPDGCAGLTSKPQGNTNRLSCRDHGFSFDGNVGETPDAGPTASGLQQIRTEFCGPLVFVNLDQNAPDLKTFFGPMWETMHGLFPEDARDVLSLDYEIEANWKVKVENTLESYHVEMVHPKSFSHMPEAEVCNEKLEVNGSSFHSEEEAPSKIDRILDRFIHKLAGAERDLTYSHYIAFPHIMFAKMRMLCWVETVYPISASRHRIVLRSFYRPTAAGAIRSGLGYHLICGWARRFGRTVSGEDAVIIPDVQRGLASPIAPSEGLLSIREERLFHFQEYIERETRMLVAAS